MVFAIGSKVIEVADFRISSLPAKKGNGIYVYYWNESFSKEFGYVSKKYKDLDEAYAEMRTGFVIVFEIEVGKLKSK